jgi:hypothetical protein
MVAAIVKAEIEHWLLFTSAHYQLIISSLSMQSASYFDVDV